nr:unnamed protein product [Callosobruchus chinensis]CAH7747927.1 unnamed protein product [Callosobruchus chinensis]
MQSSEGQFDSSVTRP